MKSIMLHSYVGEDGVLQLQIPVGMINTDLEVMVIIQPLISSVEIEPKKPSGWQPGFFEDVIGSWVGEPLVRPEQGEYEIREELT